MCERLSIFEPVTSDWHCMMCLLSVSTKILLFIEHVFKSQELYAYYIHLTSLMHGGVPEITIKLHVLFL